MHGMISSQHLAFSRFNFLPTKCSCVRFQSHAKDNELGWPCPVLSPNIPYFSNLLLCPDLNVHVNLPATKTNGQGAIPKGF